VVAKSLQEFETALRIGSEADVAQLVEQPIRNRQVISSSLIVGSILSAALRWS
jgi:hypothetical protein